MLRILIAPRFVPFKFKQILKSERDTGLLFSREPLLSQVDLFLCSEDVKFLGVCVAL